MGIELPTDLADVAAKAGVQWPQADEDAMRASAQAWRQAGTRMSTLTTEADGTANKALGAVSGSTGDAARQHWNGFVAPDSGHLTSTVAGCNAAADRLDHAADQISAAKTQIIQHLASLAKTNDAAEQAASAGHPTALLGLNTAIQGTAANVANVHQNLIKAVQQGSGVTMQGIKDPVGLGSSSQPNGIQLPQIAQSTVGGITHSVDSTVSSAYNSTVQPLTAGADHTAGQQNFANQSGFSAQQSQPGAGQGLLGQQGLLGAQGPLGQQGILGSQGPLGQQGMVGQTVNAVDSHNGPLSIPADTNTVTNAATNTVTNAATNAVTGAVPGGQGGGNPVGFDHGGGNALPVEGSGSNSIPGGNAAFPGGGGQASGGGLASAGTTTPALGMTVQQSATVAPAPAQPQQSTMDYSTPAPAAATPTANAVTGVPGFDASGGGIADAGAGGLAGGVAGGVSGGGAVGGVTAMPGPAMGATNLPGGVGAAGGVTGFTSSGGRSGGSVMDIGAPNPDAEAAGAIGVPVRGGGGASAVSNLGSRSAGAQAGANQALGDVASQPASSSAPTSHNTRRREVVALFWVYMFPIGHLPVATNQPMRQLAAPPTETDFAAGLRFAPMSHPRADLFDDATVSPEAPLRPGLPADAPEVRQLADGYDPLGGGNDRDWDRRFLVRGADPDNGRSAEYAWPPSELCPEGGCDHSEPVVLAENTVIDRFGAADGRVFAEDGTPFARRSLPPDQLDAGYHRYKVLRELPVWRTLSAAWFGQPGGGVRFRVDYPAADLVTLGYLEEIS